MFERTVQFIGGQWLLADGVEVLEVISPSTEQVVGRVPVATEADIDAAVSAARVAFDTGPWPRLSLEERALALHCLVDAIEARRDQVLQLQIDEMGATRKFALENYNALRPSLERYIADAKKVQLREVRNGVVGKVLVIKEPVGVVAGITPWNSPISVEVSKVFPSLLMGCPIVIKPAPESPLSAYILGEAAIEAGLPEGVLSIVNGGVAVGAYLVGHQGVDHVTFTGSTGGGRAIARACAEQFRTVTLELGGKSAAVILPGTDMSGYIASLVAGSLRNCGQICVSTNRIIVHEDDRDGVVSQLIDHIASLKVGDPDDPDTDFGPLAAKRQLDNVERFVASGQAEGAKVVLGGARPADRATGWYYEPTIFIDVDNKMEIAQEEIFGPVLSVITYSDVDEAVAIANESRYGLGGAVFSDDPESAIEVACRIVTGTVQVNGGPAAGGGGPFAGRKESGSGAERAVEGLETFLELKSVSLPAGYVPASV